MSTYWKQCLWIGGIYWVISLLFLGLDMPMVSLVDVCISVLFLLFLIPMNWLNPIKRVDQAMRKMPLLSTFLVSVGWVPYFVGIVFVIAVIVAGYIFASGVNQDYRLLTLFNMIWLTSAVRRLVMAVIIVVATISVLVFKKSVVGCLDRKFRLIEGDACDARTLNDAAKASAENLYACREEAEEKSEKVAEETVKAPKKKSVKTKAGLQKKASVKKQTAATAKKAVVQKKSTAVSASSAKKVTAKKTVAKKGTTKKAPTKK